ncbi:glycosyltransferase [Thalassococcus sp. CAU 1522]|uniref:Glycosyltransferase n=2 Tax=Thalassococcus arenae TaxID=2851652 RepID=A0ABS6N2K7_9RHOB|nr:glycosyltransferase [Thalassococcus arenae]
MVRAMAEATALCTDLPHVLESEALAAPDEILRAQAARWGALALRRADAPPDPDLADLLAPDFCLARGVLPWMRIGPTLVLATSRPERYAALLQEIPGDLGPVMMAITTEQDIHDAVADRHGALLAARAESWVPASESCRDIGQSSLRGRVIGLGFTSLAIGCLAVWPAVFFGLAIGLACLSLLAAQVFKLSALLASFRRAAPQPDPVLPAPPQMVSLLVPLFREPEIVGSLVDRLERLVYPRARLEALLILEAGDDATRAALNGRDLPGWMRVVEVPPGSVTTKPRAMNYALRFARGDIVGIYDAEDAPAPDQLLRVADRFAREGPEVACLQGILDFYNPRANWLSRCFAIEYASWFRVLLPGMARLGFAIPLGGTTVFFRRAALEAVHGWDAHNVTEDADLGIRLARHGYRTELLGTVTREEANNRLWPWIRQRSRWLKGYALTWWVHSRRPAALWRDVGAWKFLGVQFLFLTTLLQFALAPLLWSFWLILAGIPHPLQSHDPGGLFAALVVLFLSAEAVTLAVGLAAVTRSPHQRLLPWVPTLVAYAPLGTAAVYKALWEIMARPFYWDKTRHGISAPDAPHADLPETAAPGRG